MIRACVEADLPGVVEIYNDAVLSTTAIWNDTPVDLDNRRWWLNDRLSNGFPVLVAVDGNDVLGFASFGDWRTWQGYRYTVEHSVYVSRNARRGGVATELMTALIEHAQRAGKHVMVGGIEATNKASLALHAKLGFEKTAYMREVGAKFGRWLDLVFVQKTLI